MSRFARKGFSLEQISPEKPSRTPYRTGAICAPHAGSSGTVHAGENPECGFTLIELVMVVALIAVIGTLSVQRLDSILGWQHESELRKLTATWQFLHNESSARGEGYRLVLNLGENSYSVLREVPLDPGQSVTVDHLQNLRTRGEKERRANKEVEELRTLDEEFAEDTRRSGSLDVLYYQTLFRDPNGSVRLAQPLEFPSLAEPQKLSDGLTIRDVVIGGERVESGQAQIRLSSGKAQFALIHVTTEDQSFTIFNNPATHTVSVKSGDLNFDWTLNQKQYESVEER
jgi:prepilin-type N-terminal cleavage/methylation domain-containing protein